jgi:hypothetical protein
MSCSSCTSGNLSKFPGEMLIHHIGLKNVNKPAVWLFAEVLVCMDCGFVRFNVPATELALLTVSLSSAKLDHLSPPVTAS